MAINYSTEYCIIQYKSEGVLICLIYVVEFDVNSEYKVSSIMRANEIQMCSIYHHSLFALNKINCRIRGEIIMTPV